MSGRLTILAVALVAAPLLADASVCDRLANFARKQPASAWATGDRALAPALVVDEARATSNKPPKVTPLEAALARRKDVRDAISADGYEVFVDHLAGTDLYALSTVQGTLECQSTVLVLAPHGRPAKIIDAPKGGGDGETCWRTSEGLGRAFGQPVHAVHDMIAPTAQTADFTLTPWTGDRWAGPCKLELTFRASYTLFERRCGEEAICAPAEKHALDLALAYNQFVEAKGDGAKFTFGPAPPKLKAEVAALIASQDSPETWTPDFPAFTGKTVEDRPISYSGFAMFPIVLEGREFVAALGHEGVGWRDSENTLVAFYDLKNGVLKSLAGYVVVRSLAALTKAESR